MNQCVPKLMRGLVALDQSRPKLVFLRRSLIWLMMVGLWGFSSPQSIRVASAGTQVGAYAKEGWFGTDDLHFDSHSTSAQVELNHQPFGIFLLHEIAKSSSTADASANSASVSANANGSATVFYGGPGTHFTSEAIASSNATADVTLSTGGAQHAFVTYSGSANTHFSLNGAAIAGHSGGKTIDTSSLSSITMAVGTSASVDVSVSSDSMTTTRSGSDSQQGSFYISLSDKPGKEHAPLGVSPGEVVSIIGGVGIANDVTGSYLTWFPAGSPDVDNAGFAEYMYMDVATGGQKTDMGIAASKQLNSLTIPVGGEDDLPYTIKYADHVDTVMPGGQVDFPAGVNSFTISPGFNPNPQSRAAAASLPLGAPPVYLPAQLNLGLTFRTPGDVLIIATNPVPKPSSIMLAALGTAGLLAAAKSRKR